MSESDPVDPAPPPEAVLMRRRREALKLSPERLSQVLRDSGARLSGKRIREIELGHALGGAKHGNPTSARADTLADLASALGVLAEELEQVGRPDAARILRGRVERRAEEEPAVAALVAQRVGEDKAAALMQIVFQGLDEIRGHRRLNAAQRRELEASYLQSLQRSAEASLEQLSASLRLMDRDVQ